MNRLGLVRRRSRVKCDPLHRHRARYEFWGDDPEEEVAVAAREASGGGLGGIRGWSVGEERDPPCVAMTAVAMWRGRRPHPRREENAERRGGMVTFGSETYRSFVGIDVGARTASVAVCSGDGEVCEPWTIRQTPDGIAGLCARLGELESRPGRVLVVMEATGVYWTRLAMGLHAAGYVVSVVNPVTSRRFADMTLQQAKTDKVDARTLAHLASTLQPEPWSPPSEAAQTLRLLVRHENSLQRSLRTERNRLHALNHLPLGAEVLTQHVRAHIAFLEAQVAGLARDAREVVRQDRQLSAGLARLTSISGIGEKTALQLLGETECFARCATAEQAVAYAGLAPTPHESGESLRGRRQTGRTGSRRLRSNLFLCALRASQINPVMAEFYQRLLAAGKPKMVAIIAVARKLVVLAWTLVRRERRFDPDWCSTAPTLTGPPGPRTVGPALGVE